MNHVNLIGTMSSVPKFVELSNGQKIAQFTMSTQEHFLDQAGNAKSKKTSHRMTAWGKWLKVLEEFGNEGMNLAIEGKLVSRFYQVGNRKQFVSEVEVNDLIIL